MSETAVTSIKDLATLLVPHGFELVDHRCVNLIGPGENYGSLMLAVDATVKSCDNDKEQAREIKLVAKLSPPNEWIRKMFNIPVTFRREVQFYRDMLPALIQFQVDNGYATADCMKFFPPYYGSRLNLRDDNDGDVDEYATLLLGNLKAEGYTTVDRALGFDLDTTLLIVADLATFHAVPIAYKLKHPERFEHDFERHLEKPSVFSGMSEDTQRRSYEQLETQIRKTDACLPFIERMRRAYDRGSANFLTRQSPYREPFATIVHNDYWTNNTMIKFGDDGKPVANVMVDFQLLEYGNPAVDLIFLLFTSVQQDVLVQHYDRFVVRYHETFVDTLRKLHCDTEPFTSEMLALEMESAARESQFFHCIIMCKPIFVEKSGVKELSEFTENDMLSEDGLSEKYVRKVGEVVLNFASKGWL